MNELKVLELYSGIGGMHYALKGFIFLFDFMMYLFVNLYL